VVQLQKLVTGLVADSWLRYNDALASLEAILNGGAQRLACRGLIAILCRRGPRRLVRKILLEAARLRRGVARLGGGGAVCSVKSLIGARRSAEALRLPAARAAALLQLLHEVRMVLFDHLTELLDLFVLRRLLAKLRKGNLLVVVDDQQGDDARLELLALQAGTPDLAWLNALSGLTNLPRLTRLNNSGLAGLNNPGLTRLNNLSGLSRLDRRARSRLGGGRLGLRLC
jgi:hypothetical protein